MLLQLQQTGADVSGTVTLGGVPTSDPFTATMADDGALTFRARMMQSGATLQITDLSINSLESNRIIGWFNMRATHPDFSGEMRTHSVIRSLEKQSSATITSRPTSSGSRSVAVLDILRALAQ